MASEDRNVRENQLKAATAEFEAFKNKLKEQGLDEKQSAKNATFRSLRANVKKAHRRIAAIDKAAAHVEAVKQKETKAAKDTQAGGKKKK
jgi:hypothetical protein